MVLHEPMSHNGMVRIQDMEFEVIDSIRTSRSLNHLPVSLLMSARMSSSRTSHTLLEYEYEHSYMVNSYSSLHCKGGMEAVWKQKILDQGI